MMNDNIKQSDLFVLLRIQQHHGHSYLFDILLNWWLIHMNLYNLFLYVSCNLLVPE